jgi:pimeloyl-ACP methyl ester carboxylesterase
MALIVLVHGAFNELWGPRELHARWVPALRDGLWGAGTDIEPEQVSVSFYGDLFRHDPETEEAPDEATRAGVADMLHETLGDDVLASLSHAAGKATFERTIDLVGTLMTKPDLQERVQTRVAETVQHDTRIVVAHSLGTIVSYNALVAHPEWEIDTFVTLGSPLGSSMLVKTMIQHDDDGASRWPGSVKHWVNIAAVGDHACAEPRLSTVFGDRVVDRLVDNGHRAHDPQPYMNNRTTGSVLAEAIARSR